MACGTPVVTCRNSSLPEVGGEAAIYVDPDDTEAMCNIMEQFEQGNYKKEDYSARCLEQASKFSWHRCAELTSEVYKKCL
jgi:glycosyltransferase involved in cell wall biosynthesis